MKNNYCTAFFAVASAVSTTLTPSVYAQSPDENEEPIYEEEVVVSGVRQSLSTGIALKRNSEQIVDSIVAEDIGKLPDNSVAEALQRVTGVQITRENGEANSVLVRGLPNVVTTMNGRNIFTTTGRGIALADIPADLLYSVDVKKTKTAEDIDGGIAGLIAVRLRRPFDFDEGLTVAGGLRGVYSDLADSIDPIASVTIGQNSGDFGAMLAMSYQDRDFMDEVNFVVAPTAVDIVDPDPRSATPADPNAPSLIPGVAGGYHRYGSRNRTSFNGALQWRTDSAEYYAEAFYIGYEQDFQLNFWVPLPSWGGFLGYVDEYKPGTNVAKSYVRDDFPGTITSNQAFANTSDTYQIATGGEWSFDALSVKSDLAYTKSDAKNRGFILDLAFFAPRIEYDFSKNNAGVSDVRILNADGSPYDLFDENNYELWTYFDNRSVQEGDDISWTVDTEYELADSGITSIEAGTRFSFRTAVNQAADTGGLPNISGARIPLTDFPGMADSTPGDYLDNVTRLNTDEWLTPSRDYLLAHRDDIRFAMQGVRGDPDYRPELFFEDDENNFAAYAKANFSTEIADKALDGEIGVRAVRLETTLRGTNLLDSANPQPIKIDTSENVILPSLNTRLALRDDIDLRFGAGKTITRPDFAALNPATIYFSPGPTLLRGTGSGGNPELGNVESLNIDLSLEWYFANDGLLSVATFYRDIDGFITNFANVETFNGQEYEVSRPSNTGSGELQGWEFAYTQFYDNLPGLWAGLGLQFNYTIMDGETEFDNETIPLTFVSDDSYNIVAIYEWGGFSSRLAYNWRSDWVTNFNEGGDQPGSSIVNEPSESLDISMSYALNDALTLTFDATNLTDDVFKNYFGGDSSADSFLYPRDTIVRDRTFSLGVRFKY